MSTSSAYLRSFAVGAVWFGVVALKMVSRHPGHWSSYPPRNFIVLVVAWIITGLLLGDATTRWERLRSWWFLGLGTAAGSIAVLGIMLLMADQKYGSPVPPKFKSTDAMMTHLANEAARWVKKDRGLDLDYSLDSIKVIEEELGRISKDVDGANPQRGTSGLALAYGAYVGEVFRRRDGGSWAVDHPAGGERSYPLTTKSNVTMFPVGWCWKRLTIGKEDNVYHKAMMFSQAGNLITNVATVDSRAIPHGEKKPEPVGPAKVVQPPPSETNLTSPAAGSIPVPTGGKP